MDSLWRKAYRLSEAVFDGAAARRAANLALATARLAHLRRVVPSRALLFEIARDLDDDAVGLAALMPDALFTIAPQGISRLSAQDADVWVELFQASAHDRKTAGAYATPSVLADVLAEGALGLGGGGLQRIVDPSAGAGNLLLAAFRRLRDLGVEAKTAARALHGVELDVSARELCVLLLWLATEEAVSLSEIARRIVVDNAITRDWGSHDLFDVVLMNPPWESLRPQNDEKWDAERLATLSRLAAPEKSAAGLPPLYSAQGRGDRNLFKAFVELAPHLLVEDGRIGALVPAAFGSDLGMADLRALYFDHLRLERWTTFENRQKLFSIDSRYKFGLLFGARHAQGTTTLKVRAFCERPEEVHQQHVDLDRDDLETLGGPDRMIPEIVSKPEREILAAMLAGGVPLFDDGPLGRARYRREIDLTLQKASGVFWRSSALGMHATGSVPLLEGRMVGQYDCFQKSYVGGEARRAIWEGNGPRAVADCRSQYVCAPSRSVPARVALCDVTSSTNTRTVLATLVPDTWRCGNTAPVLQFETEAAAFAAVAILNSMTFDWMARRLLGGLHLNKFYLERFAWPSLSAGEVAELSDLALAVIETLPRGGLSSPMVSRKGVGRIDALARIELIVVSAYGLDLDAFATIANPDRSDRRGFWRYFESTPSAIEVVARVIHAMGAAAGSIAA